LEIAPAVADVADAKQCRFGGGEIFWRVTEMFEQQPRTHRADVLDHVQRDERFSPVNSKIK
jgi:hypothetical protein